MCVCIVIIGSSNRRRTGKNRSMKGERGVGGRREEQGGRGQMVNDNNSNSMITYVVCLGSKGEPRGTVEVLVVEIVVAVALE